MHDEAVATSSAPSIAATRYLSYESADSYGPTKVTDGDYYLTELTLERRLVHLRRGISSSDGEVYPSPHVMLVQNKQIAIGTREFHTGKLRSDGIVEVF